MRTNDTRDLPREDRPRKVTEGRGVGVGVYRKKKGRVSPEKEGVFFPLVSTPKGHQVCVRARHVSQYDSDTHLNVKFRKRKLTVLTGY